MTVVYDHHSMVRPRRTGPDRLPLNQCVNAAPPLRTVADPALSRVRSCTGRDESPASDAPIAAQEYRSAMRHVPAAVTVVTTSINGARQGLTVTAVASVSAEPPQLLICINRESRSAAAISAAGRFGVNFLDCAHVELAQVFAAATSDHQERFRLARWVDSANGTPLLRDALIAFDCTVVNDVDSGTHTIFIGEVTNIRAHDGRPLLYERGTFTTTDQPLGPA